MGMLSVPQTPRWLVSAGRRQQARDVLVRLRSGDHNADVDAVMDSIVEANAKESSSALKNLLRPAIPAQVVE